MSISLCTLQIFVWSMKTGRLLDILSGHEGPVHGLMFSPTNVSSFTVRISNTKIVFLLDVISCCIFLPQVALIMSSPAPSFDVLINHKDVSFITISFS